MQDCNNDKARILKALLNILETEYEAPVIIKHDQNDDADEVDYDDEELDDLDNEKK